MSLPCRSLLSASESNGFIVRLHKPKVKKLYETTYKHSGESGRRIRNATSCPLSIVSTLFLNIVQIVVVKRNYDLLITNDTCCIDETYNLFLLVQRIK